MTWDRTEEERIHPTTKPYCTTYPECSSKLWPLFDHYLSTRGLSDKVARANHWFPTRGVDGWARVIVPCYSSQPGNLYWQARLMEPPSGPKSPADETLANQTGLGMPRRWESPHGVSRGDAVVVVWPAVQADNSGRPHGVVVEGPMDALAAAGEGYVGVGLLSATPSEECLSLTAKLLHGIMTLAVMDRGAEEAMVLNAGWLRERGVPCRLVNPYPYKDLAEIPLAERTTYLYWS